MPPRMVITMPLSVTWKPSGVTNIAASSMLSALSNPLGIGVQHTGKLVAGLGDRREEQRVEHHQAGDDAGPGDRLPAVAAQLVRKQVPCRTHAGSSAASGASSSASLP